MYRVRLTRFNKEVDGNLLWDVYQDPDFCEFFRRVPATWTRQDVLNFEANTASQLFTVLWDEWAVGIVSIASVCQFSLTCQVGLLLLPDYRDKIVEGKKIAFWACLRLAELLFEKTPMRKFSMRFLKNRLDIAKSLSTFGLEKEGEFKGSCFCYGSFQDEVEYACTKQLYEKYKERGI